tara:strand:+ start:4469 stop:4711 length:243 start_codon:yes stop_codon:yes gene_type:complete
MLCYLHTNLGERMTKLKRATYSAAIKLETAQLVVDQGYTQEEAAKAMGVVKSTVSKWVTQLRARAEWPDTHSVTNDTRKN